MIDLTKWKLNKEYLFNMIDETYQNENHLFWEYGPNGNDQIGESFLVIMDEKGKTLSFILVGGTSVEYIYKLIWKG